MNLLIIESPGKQKTIQGFLGAEWRVIASMGHIRGLSHDLNFLQRDYEPTYEFLKEKSKAIAALKDAAKGAKEIYLAADRDFEGEQIAYSVKVLLKLPGSVKRITFTEITEKAIRRALENPGTIDMNRVHTQQARSMLDVLIGFTMSPLLWKHIAPSLSAGRCQIPSIRLVIEREDQILQHRPERSWALSAEFKGNDSCRTLGKGIPFRMNDDLDDEESAKNYMENVVNMKGTVVDTTVAPWTAQAPKPLITSTLQQQASALFGMNPKMTMSIAQKLYEAGHITYMRTDKAVIAEDAVAEMHAWIVEHHGERFIKAVKEAKANAVKAPKEAKAVKAKESNAQEAHEAIRPTHIHMTTIEGEGQALYRLIWQRSMQSVMAAATGETCTIQLNLDDFLWSSTSRRTIFPGWKILGKVASLDEEEEEDTNWLPQIPAGTHLEWTTMKAEPNETTVRGRYTEATLIRELEKHGIGRPSTFASLLSTIQEKNYVTIQNIPARITMVTEHTMEFGNPRITSTTVQKKTAAEKQKMVPTDLGRQVVGFMIQHFDDLFSYDFTGQMERRLDCIANGTEEWKGILRDTWESYKDRYEELNKKTQKAANAQMVIGEWNGQEIVKKTGKFGEYYQCGTATISAVSTVVEEIIAAFEDKPGVLRKIKDYVIREGKYGPYIMKIAKKTKFVSLPAGLDPLTISDKDIEGIYKCAIK